MKFESKFTMSAAMLALALGSTPLLAQQAGRPGEVPAPSAPSAQAPKAQAKSIQGELVRVDVDKKVVKIKAADAKEMEFRFTDATEVTGDSKNVEGLATKTGTKVTVEYEGQGSSMVATKIAIQPSDSAASPASPAPAPSSPAPSTPAPSVPAPQPEARP